MLKRLTAIALCAALLAYVPGLAAPGTASDPAVTKGYVDNVFIPSLNQYAEDRLDTFFAPIKSEAQDILNHLNALTGGLRDNNAARAVSKTLTFRAGSFQPVTLDAGYAIIGGDGTQFIVQSGWMQANAEMINFSDGKPHLYSADAPIGKILGSVGNAGLIAHNTSTVLVKGYYRFILPPETSGAKYTEALQAMGLITGTGGGMELERLMTRSEGVVLMLNLFGEQAQVAAYDGPSPFLDVNGTWAERGVAYAHNRGYVSGVTETAFWPNNLFSGDQFFTLILAALGYAVPQWNTAMDLAAQLGIIPQAFVAPARDHWNRDRMMAAAYQILSAKYKDTNTTVLERLIANGVVNPAVAEAAMNNVR